MAQHIFYLRNVPATADANRLRLLRDVRAAMRHLNPQASADDAEACIDAARSSGYGILGAQEDEHHGAANALATAEILRGILSETGAEVAMDIDTERADRHWRTRQAQREGKTPEQVFYEERPDTVRRLPVTTASDRATDTAMALLVPCDGNPLQAAALAMNIRRTTGDEPFWNDVVSAILRVFPWTEEPLRQSGLL